MALNERESGGPPGGAEGDPLLSRVYRDAAREEPPPQLDAALLAAACREIGARPRSIAARVHAWRVPISIAAVVVLSVSVVTLTMEEGGERLREAPMSASPARPPEAAPSPQPAPEPDPARLPQARPLASPTPALRDDAERRETSDRLQRGAAAPGEQSAESSIRPPPAKRAPVPDVSQAPAAAEDASRLRQSAPLVRRERDAQGIAETAKSAAPGLRASAVVREVENQPPEKWLERIAELRRQGHTAAADELLAEFTRRFPNHPLPLELR